MKSTDGDTALLELTLEDNTGKRSSHSTHFEPVDPILLSAIKSGSHMAYQSFYLESFDSMFDFVNTLTHNEADSEEICQQVFVRIWENRHLIDPYSNFIGYVYKMVKTATFKYFAHRKVIDNYVNYQMKHSQIFSYGTEEVVADDETALIIDLSLNAIPKQCRKVFEMSRLQGMGNDEIARELGITTDTVRSHLSHAVKKLRGLV